MGLDNQTNSVEMFSAAQTSTGYSDKHPCNDVYRSFQAHGVTSAGAGAAVVKIWMSNVASPAKTTDVDWVLAGSISLTLSTTQSTDGFVTQSGWRWVKAEIDSISGTDAAVTVLMGA